MYKILLRITSTIKDVWQIYKVTDLDGKEEEFVTESVEVLKEEIIKLDKKYGHDCVRVIKDVTVSYNVDIVDDLESVL